MTGEALIEGEYRYYLRRRWGAGAPVVFVMLNPSTADAEQDDPTIRRCIGYARAWGYGALTVVNLFALRATDPEALRAHAEPVGDWCDDFIKLETTGAALTIAAWGAHPFAAARARHIRSMVRPLYCLRATKAGHPAHPLYLPGHLRPVPFGPAP